ncbi:MAG: hypothetical protein Q4B03_00300 [Lachnospiraceae bacterium]|nr:hypothetical protein [Lachnospiraceae bacterium]
MNEQNNPDSRSEENTTIEAIEDEQEEVSEKKVLFLKAAQGYGMILGFGIGYILSGILNELGIQAGKFECVIVCMLAGMAVGYLISKKRDRKN